MEAARSDEDLMVEDAGIAILEERAPWARERAFLGASSLLFLASAMATIFWCTRMSGGMAMPGRWIMSMAWMRIPGQGGRGAAATFTGMWVVMMVAMMLPSLVPMLSIYRRSIRPSGEAHLVVLTALAAAGDFSVWAVFGAVAYSIGLVTVAAEMSLPVLAKSVPIAIGVVLLLSGFIQFTAWKSRELTHCRNAPNRRPKSPNARSAWHPLGHALQSVLFWSNDGFARDRRNEPPCHGSGSCGDYGGKVRAVARARRPRYGSCRHSRGSCGDRPSLGRGLIVGTRHESFQHRGVAPLGVCPDDGQPFHNP